MVIALPVAVVIFAACGFRSKKIREDAVNGLNEAQDKAVTESLGKTRDTYFKIGVGTLMFIFAGTRFWPSSPVGTGLLFSIPFALISLYGLAFARKKLRALDLPSTAREKLNTSLIYSHVGFWLLLTGLLISLARGAFDI